MLLGELLLPPERLQRLAWDELDCILAGQEVARQKALVPARLLATQLYNLLPDEKLGPLTPERFLPLWAIDPPAKPAAVPTESAEEFRARMVAQNAKTLAARAAASTSN